MKAVWSIVFTLSIASMSFAQKTPRQLTEQAVKLLETNIDSAKVIFEQAFRMADQDTVRAGIAARFCGKILHEGEEAFARHYMVLICDSKSFDALPRFYKARTYYAFFDIHYWALSDYDSCLYYANQWIAIAPDSIELAYAYLERGAAYAEIGNNLKALGDFNTALNTAPKIDRNMEMLSSLHNNFGMLYSDEHEYEKAAEYFEKAIEYAKDSPVPGGKLPMLNNLGVLNLWMGKYDKSLEYLKKAAELLPAYDRPWATANNIQNQGNALTMMGKPSEGLAMYEQSMAMFGKLKEAHKIAGLHRLKAEAYRLLGDYRKAEQEALECLNWDLNEGSGELVKESYQELYKIYSATHQYEKAFAYQNKYLAIIDSLNSAERKTQFGLLEKNFELEQQESIREKLETENQLHLAQEKTDRVARISLIAGSIALAIAVVISFMAYRRSRFKSKKIEAQAEQLREAAKTKARFFANVSHELRTPVTLLSGMLELMKDNNKVIDATEKLQIALSNSRKLQAMLDDVLDLSRAEEGKWELIVKRKPLLPLLNRIVFAFESLLVKKNIELRYDASAIEGLEIDVDEDKFEKIINNLIYNAVKFNEENGRINISAQRDEHNVVIQVSDSGIGIAENELPYIFDRHYQSAATDKLHSQGIGIGLALVREFTALHGGEVTVTSRVNEGSSFTVKLPIGNSTSPSTPKDTADEDLLDVSFDNFGRKPKVLIVEDNDEMRYYLKEILGAHVSPYEAENGRIALEWLTSNKPDLIISDIMMPVMDGYEFLSHLKSANSYRGIPVMMLTARGGEEDLLQGLSLGVDDYIIKPFSSKELKIRIHNLLTNQEIRREWSQKTESNGEAELPSSPSENELFIEKVKEFVEANASNASLGVGDLGEHLAMSERQVYRKAATLTGMTPGQLVKEIRLRIAYKLLLEKKVRKVSDLAQRVGFENSSYFSRQFLERYGKRPADLIE